LRVQRVVTRPAPAAAPSATTPATTTLDATAPASRRTRIPARALASRTHVVRPGESLWSIATRLVPATATNAHVAREVQRLWRLNRDRLRQPDLLPVGTVLRLR